MNHRLSANAVISLLFMAVCNSVMHVRHILFICSSVDELSAWYPGAVKLGHQIALVLVSEASVLSAHLVQKERDCLSLLMVSLLRNGFQPSLGALIRCKEEARRIACAACKSQSTHPFPIPESCCTQCGLGLLRLLIQAMSSMPKCWVLCL